MSQERDGIASYVDRRTVLRAATVAGISVLAGGAPYVARAASKELVILGWEGYLTGEIVSAFHKETGVEIKPVLAGSDQEMFTKLRAGGGADFDLVYANAGYCPLYFRAGLTEAFQAEEVAAAQNLFPVFVENAAFPYISARGELLLFPHNWAPLAMMWNTESISLVEPYSWNALWDTRVPEGRVAFGGGTGDDFLAITGVANGVPAKQAYSMSDEQLVAAEQRLKALKRFQVVTGSDSEFRARFRDGRAVIGLSSQLGAAEICNREVGKSFTKAVVPIEGTLGWVDGPQLVKGARNRENAIKFMEFIGTSNDYWDVVFAGTGSAPCNRVQVERLIAEGGNSADVIRVIQANNPELAEAIIMQAPPANPRSYAAAWDRLQSSIN